MNPISYTRIIQHLHTHCNPAESLGLMCHRQPTGQHRAKETFKKDYRVSGMTSKKSQETIFQKRFSAQSEGSG